MTTPALSIVREVARTLNSNQRGQARVIVDKRKDPSIRFVKLMVAESANGKRTVAEVARKLRALGIEVRRGEGRINSFGTPTFNISFLIAWKAAH